MTDVGGLVGGDVGGLVGDEIPGIKRVQSRESSD
jgi:hypothetical protein